MIVFVYMLAQRECDLHFYVKRDCLLFSVNVKLFFEFFVMREDGQLLLRESVFIRGIGDPHHMRIRTAEVQFMRDNPERFIESSTENSWLR